nr:reverse transcriptase domain-containing protein [Tanacetum cinerariifolium]
AHFASHWRNLLVKVFSNQLVTALTNFVVALGYKPMGYSVLLLILVSGLDTNIPDELLEDNMHVNEYSLYMRCQIGGSGEIVMSSSPHSTIVPSNSDIENTFSSTNILNYFSASPRSISPDFSNDFTKYLLDILIFSPLHDDLKMEVIEAYDTILPPQVVIALPAILPPSLMPPKRTSTSATLAMTEDTIRQLITEGVAASLITWTELKRLLTNKYRPRTKVKKMEDEFYNLVVKGDDLKTYVMRFQELAVLCPNMVPNSEKIMEAFIGGLPHSIEGNVTASKAQTLEEATNISHKLMDQILKNKYVQETNDHK